MREDDLRQHLAAYAEASTGMPAPSPRQIRGRVARRRAFGAGVAAVALATVGSVIALTVNLAAPKVAVPSQSPSETSAQGPVHVEKNPHFDVRCRDLTDVEHGVVGFDLNNASHGGPWVVDVADGYSVAAYWTPDDQIASVVITDTSVSPDLPENWDGVVPDSGDILADGPRANEAALSCLTDIIEPADQPQPAFTCETPTRDELLRVQQAVWGGPDGNPTGGGVFVRGGTTPEGKPWRIFAVNTDGDTGSAVVLVTLPSAKYKTGAPIRSEYSPISEYWDGELAEFRGHVQWGVEGYQAALACLESSG